MRDLICTLAFVFLTQSILAQTNNGKWSVGANLSYSHSGTNSKGDASVSSTENSNSMGYYDIKAGYFLSDNFIIGLKGIYNTNKNVNSSSYSLQNSYTNENNSLDIGFFCRYYHMFKESKFGWFGELNASYTIGVVNSKSISPVYGNTFTDGELTGYKISILPGIIYFASSKIAFETTFGLFSYTNSTTDYVRNMTGAVSVPEYKYTDDENSFTSNLSFNTIRLGVSYYFGAGKK